MKKKIMLVDDEPDIRSTIKTILEKEGYEVTTANNAKDCLTKTKNKKFDLILMDIMMPGNNVKETVEKIKDTPIAYLSVVDKKEAKEEDLLSKKIIAYINKPISIKSLISKINKITK